MSTIHPLPLRAPASRRRPVVAIGRLATIGAFMAMGVMLGSCYGGLPMPGNETSTGQMLLDVNNALVQMREDNAFMQAQIDSLRGAVAYQDTIIHQLAALANVSVRPLSSSFP